MGLAGNARLFRLRSGEIVVFAMRPLKRALLTGLLLYVLSFALASVNLKSPPSEPMRGYTCALLALFNPWDHDSLRTLRDGLRPAIEWIALALSGWINLVFLVSFSCIRWPRIFRGLRIAFLAMAPAPWIIFSFEGLYPREGYFMWVAGMALAFFSWSNGQNSVGEVRLSPKI